MCSGHNCAGSHADLDDLGYAAAGHTGFAPSPHDNTDHSPQYLHQMQAVASIFSAAAVNVDATAAVTLATVTPTLGAGSNAYLLPMAFMCNVEPGTIAINAIVDFWIEVAAVQRSAKFPLHVIVAEAYKHSFTLTLVSGSISHTAFWSLIKGAGSYAVTIRAQRQANADPAAANVIVTDKAFTLIVMTKDI